MVSPQTSIPQTGGKTIVIIGGGLGGMAATVALQSAGCRIILVEARKSLGGRAGSFEDPQSDEILDNCQHVLLGCCTNLIDFYARIGASDRIAWQATIHFIDPRGRPASLYATPGLPAPLHLGLAGLTFSALSFSDRLALGRAMLAMQRLGRQRRAGLADVSFGDWLARHNQPKSLIDTFYDLVLVSALNEDCRKASAACAIQVFQEGMLENAAAYRMGTPACPLAELYAKFPGSDVRLSTRLSRLCFDQKRVTGVELSSGEKLNADAVILAVNYQSLEKFVPAELAARDNRFAHLGQLESVPILGAHLNFDRPILSTPHAALMTGPLQWLFRKPGDDGRAVHGVISAARDWIGRPKQECLDIFQKQLRDLIPQARDAKLLRGVIVIEKRATFSPLPGVDRLRPNQSPPVDGIAGLYLAGDYTQTGWPATMEGAVRSGYLAAEGVLGEKGRFIVPDLPLQWPAKFFDWAMPVH
jgi:zeta-carotene desaturase